MLGSVRTATFVPIILAAFCSAETVNVRLQTKMIIHKTTLKILLNFCTFKNSPQTDNIPFYYEIYYIFYVVLCQPKKIG